MSAKTIIKNLDDSQLLKIFIDFVRKYNLEYQKVHKEISQKCFEGTWIINGIKATGYGRTETEAYKSGLKNLLQIYLQHQQYLQYFSDILRRKGNNNSINNSTPLRTQLKTELYENQQRIKAINENCTKINYPNKGKPQIYHSKINLNRNVSQNMDAQIEQAKEKVKRLQTQLNIVLDQNKILKERLNESNVKYKDHNNCSKGEKDQFNKAYQNKIQNFKNSKQLQTTSKISVPKLNLQILPNYHKRSQKCLNNMLLAAYNEKRKA